MDTGIDSVTENQKIDVLAAEKTFGEFLYHVNTIPIQ